MWRSTVSLWLLKNWWEQSWSIYSIMSRNRHLPPRACVYVWSGAGPLGVGVAPPCMFSLVSSPPPHWFRSQQGVSRVWSFWTKLYVQASDNRYTHIVPATITFYLPSHTDPLARSWSAWEVTNHMWMYILQISWQKCKNLSRNLITDYTWRQLT
jgi:hypothetical protein